MPSESRLRALRAWWRTVHPPPTLTKRLEPVYYVFITLAIGGPFVYGTASTALAEVATPAAVATWGPAVALLGLLAVARWGAVQGPVVFSEPDVAQLLGAPLPRAELVLGRLLRGLLTGTGVAAILGGIVAVGLAGEHRGIAVARAAGLVAGVALLGLLAVAVASLVQNEAGWDRATRRAVWPAVALAAGLVALAGSGAAGKHAVLWSGPWGWAVQPGAAAAAAWPVALALLAVVTALALRLALARRGQGSTERHLLRAEARGGALAALYSMNARYVRRSLTRVSAGPAAAGRPRLRPPRSAALAVVWRDAASALAAPQRLGEALVLAAGGTLVALVNGTHPVAVGAGALALYVAAARLLEPLRAETDKPGRARVLLRARMGRVLAEHAVVPAAVVLAGALLATAGCAAAGALPAHGEAAAALAILAAPPIALCAALSSRRGGQLPASVMAVTFGDVSGMSTTLVIGWIVLWPVLAIALGTVPLSVIVHDGTASLPQLAALLACAAAALAGALSLEYFAP
jgi:hypothetical protein